jgi:hypothetical protein
MNGGWHDDQLYVILQLMQMVEHHIHQSQLPVLEQQQILE